MALRIFKKTKAPILKDQKFEYAPQKITLDSVEKINFSIVGSSFGIINKIYSVAGKVIFYQNKKLDRFHRKERNYERKHVIQADDLQKTCQSAISNSQQAICFN